MIMLVLFLSQFLLPTVFTRGVIAIIFATLAIDILMSERELLRPLLRSLRFADRGG
jgi:hypothetical protein